MLGSERAYLWVKEIKETDPEQYNKLKANIDEAFVTIKRAFRDNALTKGCVELYFTDENEYEKRQEILTKSLTDVDTRLCELQAQRADIVKSLEMLNAILGKEKKVDINSAIREGMRRTHALKGEQIARTRQVLEQQKQAVAEQYGEETAKVFVEQQTATTVVKRKKKVVANENGSD